MTSLPTQPRTGPIQSGMQCSARDVSDISHAPSVGRGPLGDRARLRDRAADISHSHFMREDSLAHDASHLISFSTEPSRSACLRCSPPSSLVYRPARRTGRRQSRMRRASGGLAESVPVHASRVSAGAWIARIGQCMQHNRRKSPQSASCKRTSSLLSERARRTTAFDAMTQSASGPLCFPGVFATARDGHHAENVRGECVLAGTPRRSCIASPRLCSCARVCPQSTSQGLFWESDQHLPTPLRCLDAEFQSHICTIR